MSEVKRYDWCRDGGMELDRTGEYVTYEDHQSELAALWEELAQVKKASIVEIMALNGVIERQRHDLSASERKNDELAGLLRSASTDYACCLESGYDRITSLGGDCDSVEKMLSDNPNYSRYRAALTKPTESGASE